MTGIFGLDAALASSMSMRCTGLNASKSATNRNGFRGWIDQPASTAAFNTCMRVKPDRILPLHQCRDFKSRGFRNANAMRAASKKVLCVSNGIAQPESISLNGNITPNDLLTLTTFNILAPIYKRLNGNERLRESQQRDLWISRNKDILELLLEKQSSIICLQEFWLANEELLDLYTKKLGEHGYELFNVPRTNGRGDGLLTAVHTKRLKILDHREILFHDCGDRVAQILFLECIIPDHHHSPNSSQTENGGLNVPQTLQFLVVNTHLLFPHNGNSSLIRIREVYKILESLEAYRNEKNLRNPLPILLCGDWNGSKKGNVYKFLRSQGFISSYDVAKNYSDDEFYEWVSHKNHHGNLCGVDYIWLLNPKNQNQPLNADWKAAIFSMIKAKLEEAGFTREKEAFSFFQSQQTVDQKLHRSEQPDVKHPNHDYFTLKDFQYAMDKLGLTGEGTVGLTEREISDLVTSADVDGNGVIDYFEFKRLFNFDSMEQSYSKIKEATGITEQPWTVSYPSSTTTSSSSSSSPSLLLTTATIPASPLLDDETKNWSDEKETLDSRNEDDSFSVSRSINLEVKEAFLFPEEMECASWPEDYSLSDHAPLTACFVLEA